MAFKATDSEADILVATDDEQDGKPKRHYTSRRQTCVEFLGKRVCVRACARLLGVGQTTLQRLRNGEEAFTMHHRQPLSKHPSFGFTMRGETGQKWVHAVLYLWLVYHSSAECLPTDFVSGFKSNQKAEEIDRQSECKFPEGGADDESVLRSVHGFMRSLHQYNSDIEAQMIGPGFLRGERRHLPHGSRTEMFFEYRAHCRSVGEEEPASFATFLRVANKVFGPHMRSGFLHFRKPSEHAVCDICTRLKRSLRFRRGAVASAGGPNADADAVRAYTSHILHQWLDRQCYWSLRTLSQSWFRRESDLAERPSWFDQKNVGKVLSLNQFFIV